MLLNGVNNAPVQTSFKTNTPVGLTAGRKREALGVKMATSSLGN